MIQYTQVALRPELKVAQSVGFADRSSCVSARPTTSRAVGAKGPGTREYLNYGHDVRNRNKSLDLMCEFLDSGDQQPGTFGWFVQSAEYLHGPLRVHG